MREPAISSTSDRMTAADVKAIVRSVLLQCGVPFTAIDITSSPAAWKVVVHDQTGMIFRLKIHAGPPHWVRQTVLEAIESEW
jgi:LEA14-like dessication related protein